jgi:hypothetical protein
MLFSTHISDTGPLKALRRKTPDPSEVSGLRSARTAICAPFTAGILPKPQLGREALLACWEDEDSLDRFLTDHPTGRVFADGLEVRMELFRAVGVWPGTDDDMAEACRCVATPTYGPHGGHHYRHRVPPDGRAVRPGKQRPRAPVPTNTRRHLGYRFDQPSSAARCDTHDLGKRCCGGELHAHWRSRRSGPSPL